eukprot:m.160326 g.160326  ORF g.160326 m.160326 type:complete len:70 (+) comp18020_c0_seq4:577-786(+)
MLRLKTIECTLTVMNCSLTPEMVLASVVTAFSESPEFDTSLPEGGVRGGCNLERFCRRASAGETISSAP